MYMPGSEIDHKDYGRISAVCPSSRIKHLHETEECTKKHYAIRQVEVRSDHH